MRLKKLIPLCLFLAPLLTACSLQQSAGSASAVASPQAGIRQQPDSQAVNLNVFAAASLIEAFQEIGLIFSEQNPGVSVVFNFASSQQLVQQINAGAPADIFASANQRQMETLLSAGHFSGMQHTFARNRLVVIFPKDNPAEIKALEDLAKPNLKLLLAAKEVPVGQYALEFLDNSTQDARLGPTFKDQVLHNVISYEENVKAVLSKVTLGEADAGIVYTSDISGDSAGKVGWLDIPDHLNILASYPIAVMQQSKHPKQAEALVALVLSAKGQDILARYGFIPVEK